MKSPEKLTRTNPQYDYGPALQSAVSWLGDRYLLAEPVARRPVEHPPFFVERPRWLEAQRANRLRSRKH